MEKGKIDINKLSETKRKLLSRLLQEKSREQKTVALPIQEKKEYYPLSYNQEQLWFLETLEKDSPFYNVIFATRFKKKIDIKVIRTALNEVSQRHQILRTYYIAIAGKPYQRIDPDFTPELVYRDLQGEKDPETQALERLTQEAKIPFNLAAPPIKALLFGLSAVDYILMMKFHHTIIDGWSMPIFYGEFLHACHSIEQGREPGLPSLRTRYKDFAVWQRRKIQSGGFDKQLQYWKKQLAGDSEPLDLPMDFPRPREQSFRGKRLLSFIPADLLQQLKALSKDTEYTLYMLVTAGLSILLSRYSGKKDIFMGTQIANRLKPGLESLIGYFSNTVVLRCQVPQYAKFNEYLHHVKHVVRQSQENQEFPFEKLVQELHVPRTLGQNPLFQVMMVYHTQTIISDYLQQFNASEVVLDNNTAKFDLDISLIEGENKIDISIIYNTDIFSQPRIERMFSHFKNILRIISRDPGERISNIDFLTEEEKHRIIYTWNDTGTWYPGDSCLHSLFEQRAAEDPRAFCVYHRDKQVTREELEEKANRLARYLKRQGIGPNRLAAICMEKSIDMVIGLTAILKAGGGYLPIDPTYPPGRIEYMLTQSRAVMILTQHHLCGIFPGAAGPITRIDSQWEDIAREPAAPCPLVNTPGDIVYGIFTSGSTGNPKMTVLDHRGRVNNFTDFNRRFNIGKQDRLLAVSSLGFDMCAYDILGNLAGGSAIVLPEPDFELQPAHWAALMTRHDVTAWHSVPSKLELLTAYIEANPAYIPGKCRLVLLGGDWIPLHLPDRFRACVPTAVIVSLGGATEVSMDSTIYIIGNVEPTWKSIPYGKPMANQLTYIIDANFNLVPEGIPGELCIGGVGVGWGYYGNPALTAEKFIPNPWSQIPGDRMYRTGDLARYRSDGVLELLGRIDYQVKIRGYRIELGEIEAALNHHELIDKALVMAKKDPARRDSPPKIIAYIIPGKNTAQHLNLTPGNLRLYLKDRLPEYFIPAAFIFLHRFPLTPNGKIDRRALQELDINEESQVKKTDDSFTPPTSKIEKLLAAAWTNLLSVENISIHDNFFSLGGDSIKCIQLVARAREAGLDITLKQTFRHQTIFELAKAIEKVENLDIKESIPLTAHQYLLISEMNTYHHPLVEDIWLELQHPVTPGMCKEALNIITRDYDCFKLRFQAGENGWRQSYDALRSNLMYFTHVEIAAPGPRGSSDQKIFTRTHTMIETAIDLLDGPLLGAALFTTVLPHHHEPHGYSSSNHRPSSSAVTLPGHQDRQKPVLLLAIPRLILAGISQYTLIRDLERIMFKTNEENLPGAPARRSFVKWTRDHEQELFRGPVQVECSPPAKSGAGPDWQSEYYSLELNQVTGLKEVLQTQPLISLAEMLLTALCCAWAQENQTGTIGIDLLLSTREKTGELLPPGSHGDFFTLRARAVDWTAPADSLKWVHHFLTVNQAGKQNRDLPRQTDKPLAISVHIVDPGGFPGIHDGPHHIEPVRSLISPRQCYPLGTNALQLYIRPGGDGLWIDVLYDRYVKDRAAIESFYHCSRETLNRIPAIYARDKHMIYTKDDFPGTGISREDLHRLFRVYPGLIDIYPLNPMQRYMLENWKQFTGIGLYFIRTPFFLPANLDIPAFEKSWRQLIRDYDALRTVLVWKGLKNPVQVLLDTMELSIQKEDWRGKKVPQQEKDLVELIEKQRATGFDLEKGPLIRLLLLRLNDEGYLFLRFNTYFILDGWSLALLNKELLALYKANTGETGYHETTRHRYRHYIDWLGAQNPAAAMNFWKDALQGINAPTLLYQAKQNQDRIPHEKNIDCEYEKQTAEIDKNITRELQRIAQENKITFNTMVTAGTYLVLRDWLQRSDLVIGVVSSGRPPGLDAVESMIGFFVNIIPLRIHCSMENSFIDVCRKVGKFLNSAAPYEYINLDEIKQNLNPSNPASLLFDIVLVFSNYPVDKSLLEAAGQEPGESILPMLYLNHVQVELPLRIDTRTFAIEHTSFIFSYYRDKFAPRTIAEFSKGLVEKLTLIAQSPLKPIKDYLIE